MNRKEWLQHKIESLHSYLQHPSPELKQRMQVISAKLDMMTNEEIEAEANQATIQPAEEEVYDHQQVKALLYRAIPLMEQAAKKETEHQYEVLQIINQLRGELGLATDPPSPE